MAVGQKWEKIKQSQTNRQLRISETIFVGYVEKNGGSRSWIV